MEDASYTWHPVVSWAGSGLDDLSRCLSATISWLQDRGIDPQSLGINDIRFVTAQTPEGPAIEARIRLDALLPEQMPVVFEGVALGRRFTFSYAENLLESGASVAIERPDGTWRRGGGGSRSLMDRNGRAQSWSSVGLLDDGIWGLAIGTDPSHVASARLYRGTSDEAVEFPLYRTTSRFDAVCAATLIDEDGATIEYLDSTGEVVRRESY